MAEMAARPPRPNSDGPRAWRWTATATSISRIPGTGRIRKVDAATGAISTIAGTGENGYGGDGGPASEAQLGALEDVAVDAAGNLYIADHDIHRIRKVDATTGTISTIAGTGEPGYSGDGGPATEAQLGGPSGVAVGWGGQRLHCGHGEPPHPQGGCRHRDHQYSGGIG